MEAVIHLLSQSELSLWLVTGILGLLVGSFLNVVIYRLPLMMERGWRSECTLLMEIEVPEGEAERFNLMAPRSSCPNCGHMITALENIPVISYLIQRGKCSSCKTSISAQYPILELATALLSVIVVWQMGFSWQSAAALVFTWSLITLSTIDFKTQLLPDQITLPLVWLGLLINLNGIFTDYSSSLIGAVLGYLSLWSVYHLFRLLTGKEGMGYGDFKLLAALGAWMGWQMLPIIILLSSVLGALIGITLMATGKHKQGTPMPFGPFLALAGWVALFWGEAISGYYLRVSGLG